MPADEAKARMAAIRATVEASDVRRWARGFLELLGGRERGASRQAEPADGTQGQEGRPWVGPSAA